MDEPLSATPIRPESARYAASLVCLPGLWTPPVLWQGLTTYLAHRGWEGAVLDLRRVRGGIAARAAEVAQYVTRLPGAPILIGHDAGALVALAVAARTRPAALVLLAPLVPGATAVRALGLRFGTLPALLLRLPVPAPRGAAAAPLVAGLPSPVRTSVLGALAPEAADVILDVARARVDPAPVGGVPALLVGGGSDPLLSPQEGAGFARTIGAEHQVVPEGTHWLLAGPGWEETVAVVHRWLVQRLGEPLLEFYPEALAAREAEDGET